MIQHLNSDVTESQFARYVSDVSRQSRAAERLVELLDERHPVYEQRGTRALVSMRGWVLLKLASMDLPKAAVLFVLEELQTGMNPYLVAAAAKCVRAYSERSPEFVPFLLTAIQNIRRHDEPLELGEYGQFSDDPDAGGAMDEIFATLLWLGTSVAEFESQISALLDKVSGLPEVWWPKVKQVLVAAKEAHLDASLTKSPRDCCRLPTGISDVFKATGLPRRSNRIGEVRLEDQSGNVLTFNELFVGRPTIVAFFYTRCDNPLKCSLTVTKLARIQKILEDRGLAGQINTAALTYDPDFDSPERLKVYGADRQVVMDGSNRLLRAVSDMDSVNAFFQLGVNFNESLVNRHRIELFVLNSNGHVARRFERVHWDESSVVEAASEFLQLDGPNVGTDVGPNVGPNVPSGARKAGFSSAVGTLASLGIIFFPKCPFCWAAYMSAFGIAGLERIPYSPWLVVVFVLMILVNLACVWLRGFNTGRMAGFYLAMAGTTLLATSYLLSLTRLVSFSAVMMIAAGSLYGATIGSRTLLSRVVRRRSRVAV